ncbi:potassium channel family protein [Paraburkholderia tropica]|uniref:potassium channel family protein n=1 Tax=Paraburkholderia tropica TaxID=92647 RepID=UPI002ABE7E39|nr:potassium channel family protein [Paraburkholderia tropica]
MENNQISGAGDEMSPKRLADPHHKAPMTSPFGRFVERASYTDLAVAGVGVLLMATAYFRWGPSGHTLKATKPDLLEAAYFSFVTFTSLGYGDLNPVGFGRFVAVLVVLFGLVFIALLVGKFASERQQAVLLLLHTSDCQRRLNDFTSELDRFSSDLKEAAGAGQTAQARSAAKNLTIRVEAASNYLVFNANQARLMAFGNESALIALYSALSKVQRLSIDVHRTEKSDLLLSRRTRALANRCEGLVKLMQLFHESTEQQTSYIRALWRRVSVRRNAKKTEPSALVQRVLTISTSMSERGDVLRTWMRSGFTPAVCELVWSASPAGEPATWGADLHKRLANELQISNSLAQRCLIKLREEGRLPKPVQKKRVRRSKPPASEQTVETERLVEVNVQARESEDA